MSSCSTFSTLLLFYHIAENPDQRPEAVSADNPAFMIDEGTQNEASASTGGNHEPNNATNHDGRKSPIWTNHQLQPPSPNAIYVISQDTNEIKI